MYMEMRLGDLTTQGCERNVLKGENKTKQTTKGGLGTPENKLQSHTILVRACLVMGTPNREEEGPKEG